MDREASLLHVGEGNFEEHVLQSGKAAMVEFWASWCGPCREVAAHVEALAQIYAGRVIVARVDVDKNRALAKRLSVRNVPTVVFFKDGKMVDRLDGAASREEMERKLEQVLWEEGRERKMAGVEEAQRMLETGLITAEEYEATRRQLLGDGDS